LRRKAFLMGAIRPVVYLAQADPRDHGARLRALARWLELRSFGLAPENFNIAEGLRASTAVALPLGLVLASRSPQFGWAIFAAFWTCLSDVGGARRKQIETLLLFVTLGTGVAFFASWIAGFGRVPAFATGPAIVALAALLPLWRPASGSVAALLGVVAVVAVGYPHGAPGAATLAIAFLLGGAWAVLLTWRWEIDRWAPARHALAAVFARLADMASAMAATGAGRHHDRDWHANHGQHRRAVRIAIERAGSLIDRLSGESATEQRRFKAALAATEAVFSASIALDHLFVVQDGAAEERIGVAKALYLALATAHLELAKRRLHDADLAEQAASLRRLAISITGVEAAILNQVGDALDTLGAREPAEPPLGPAIAPGRRARTPRILRGGLRSAAAVAIVYLVADLFHFGYPYWATMAVVVVMQPGMRTTWTRSIERILGTVLGGLAALALLHTVTAPIALILIVVTLAGLTIAVRSVSYTVFVTTLTLLFVTVVELLQVGAGVASARVLDNVVGSLTAIVSAILLWPDSSERISDLIAAALEANQAYLDRVRSGDEIAIVAARRAAGLASIEAELALHALGGFVRWRRRLSRGDIAAIMESRRLAGEASMLWHSNLFDRTSDAAVAL